MFAKHVCLGRFRCFRLTKRGVSIVRRKLRSNGAHLMQCSSRERPGLEVSTLVNKPGVDRPECISPVSSLSL
jgi:hypothetical protein